MRLFGVLTNSTFTTSGMMYDYYLLTWYIRAASQVVEQLKIKGLRKLGNIRKVPKLDKMTKIVLAKNAKYPS